MQFLSSPSTPTRPSSSSSNLLPHTPSRAILFPAVLERQSSNILLQDPNEKNSSNITFTGAKRAYEGGGGDTPKQAKRGHFSSDQNQSDNTLQATTPHSSSKSNTNVTNIPPSSPMMSNATLQDRFIPNRSSVDFDYTYYMLTKMEDEVETTSNTTATTNTTTTNNASDLRNTPGQRKLKQEISNITSPDRKRVVDCRQSLTPTFDKVARNSLQEQMQESRESRILSPAAKKVPRVYPSVPARILDAPDLMNDYYLNLLHWGKSNLLAVALANSVYLWHPGDGHIDTLLSLEDTAQHISSVQFSPDGTQIAVGTSLNTVQLWDIQEQRIIRELLGHSNRISSMSWMNDRVLSSGGRDSLIINHDYRVRRNAISYYTGHQQEVCGLTWSPDGSCLASGGNDNILCLWDPAMSNTTNTNTNTTPGLSQQSFSPRIMLDQHHTAAVKALSWCPWQRNILASGGGTVDRTIRIWNATNGNNLKCVDTGSQVCALQWNEHHKEIISSHGFSDNQLIIWRYQDMHRAHELRGHTARVLHMAKSPCGNTICSASADESLRFWDISSSSSSSSTTSRDVLLSPNKQHRRGTSLLLSPSASSMSIR